MARKPARMYREVKSQAYTRKEYVGGIPGLRLAQFLMGNKKGEFEIELALVAGSKCHIRHTALESARVSANRFIQKRAGNLGYKLRIHVYPHILLRENKQATGAGADRISQGMRKAFGKIVGTAARVKDGQTIMTLHVNRKNFLFAKEALRKANSKLPTQCKIRILRGEELVQ
ncbi:MAG TPA: 50S ribosomal protein L16 [Thermoplasmata archaeon]|nr:50S ribosomal protein L16 [Thermoplasmata archaeon]